MTKKYASIVLWDGIDCAVEQVNHNIEILTSANIGNVCCALTLPKKKQHHTLKCQTFIDKKNIGSFMAVRKALNYFQSNHINYKDGLIIVYGHAYLTERTVNKLFQISAIANKQPSIKGFVSIRMTKGQQKLRFKQAINGILCDSYKSSRGHEACGLMLLTPKLLPIIKNCPARQMSDFIAWCILNKNKLYGIIDGCCGDPYTF